MAEPADLNVDELRRRARRRLVGAVVLALGVAVIVPMLLETEQKPLGDDVSVKIPPIDDSKFVNRLNDKGAKDSAQVSTKAQPKQEPAGAAPTASASPSAAERTSKYDTRVTDTLPGAAAAPAQTAPAADSAPASAKPPSPPESRPAEAAKADSPSSARFEPAKSAGVPAAPKALVAAAPHDGFAVQLAAFADDKGANSLAGRLKRAGYTAYTEPLKTSKGTLWRVRVGPYPSHEAAVVARDKLKAEGQSGIVAAIR